MNKDNIYQRGLKGESFLTSGKIKYRTQKKAKLYQKITRSLYQKPVKIGNIPKKQKESYRNPAKAKHIHIKAPHVLKKKNKKLAKQIEEENYQKNRGQEC